MDYTIEVVKKAVDRLRGISSSYAYKPERKIKKGEIYGNR